MDKVCPTCNVPLSDDMAERLNHQNQHEMQQYLDQVEQMMQRMMRASTAYHLAMDAAHISLDSGKSIDEVLDVFSEGTRKLMESGLF